MNEAKNKKLLEQFTEKSKRDIEKLKRENDDEVKRIEDDYYVKIDAKQKKIAETEERLDQIKLEKDKFEQENILYTTLSKENKKGVKNRDSDREVKKLQEKININDELFK